jgi:hypothetical protein
MKIGICWGGNSDHTRDFLRSMPILAMKELIENKIFVIFLFLSLESEDNDLSLF